MDGYRMAKNLVPEVRTRVGETEKLTINLGVVDLGQIDLLVQEGFYSNRTDLIRTAIRNQLSSHGEEVKRTVARRTLVLGLQHFGRAELERVAAAGQMLQIQVVGLARIADDVSPKLALATIRSIEVLGAFHASAAVRKALADRIL
jgi:Arc/MetJ-type ribon-helix-helix transcriptional regulator